MVFKMKKGVVFSVIALIITFFLLASFFFLLEVPVDAQVDVVRLKVGSANDFLFQVESFVKAQSVLSAEEAVGFLIGEMNRTNSTFDDFDNEFENCLLFGETSLDDNCGEGANFQGFLDDLSEFSESKLNKDVDFNVRSVSLDQVDPWELLVNVSLDVILVEEGYAFWNVSLNTSSSFSIIGFYDPVYAAPHDDLLDYKFDNLSVISRYPGVYRLFVDDWKERPSTLNFIVMGGHYFEHNRSPSFLDRLRGPSSSWMGEDPAGIASLVSPYSFGDFKVDSGSSNLDWQFWNNFTIDSFDYGTFDFDASINRSLKYEILNDSSPPNLENITIPVEIALGSNMSNVSGDYFFLD